MIFMGVAVMAIILAFRGSGILEMAEKRIYRGRG
jgi:hypothetical protein